MHERTTRSRSRDRDQFRTDVVLTARRLFLEMGINQTSMARLGRELGVSKPTVYEVFSGKQLLIEAVFKSAADDVDFAWILNAAEELPSLPDFLDQTAKNYKALVSNPKSLEAFRLLVREGGQSADLTAAFLRYLSVPASIAARKYIGYAIANGQCVAMEEEVIQKLMTAPLFYLIMDKTLLQENSMRPELVSAYLDAFFSALKAVLCVDAGGLAQASRVPVRDVN